MLKEVHGWLVMKEREARGGRRGVPIGLRSFVGPGAYWARRWAFAGGSCEVPGS